MPTPLVELRCDNDAAKTLSTGEGSWKTKSTANKVHRVTEKVELGIDTVEYVSTIDQCADSLTKFLKGGPEQRRSVEHLAFAAVKPRQPKEGFVRIKTKSWKTQPENMMSQLNGFRSGFALF